MQATHKEERKWVLYLNMAAKFMSHLSGRDQNQNKAKEKDAKSLEEVHSQRSWSDTCGWKPGKDSEKGH